MDGWDRRRLRAAALMGSLPVGAALGVGAALRGGLVRSDNAQVLAGIALLGCAGMAAIAVLAAALVCLEAGLRRLAHQMCSREDPGRVRPEEENRCKTPWPPSGRR